jgi:hypothetical protein
MSQAAPSERPEDRGYVKEIPSKSQHFGDW